MVGVLVMMFVISPLLALIALVTVPLAVLLTRVIAKRSQPQFMEQWANTGKLNGHIEEAFTGHEVVKVFGRQEQSREAFDEHNNALFNASFKAQFMSGIIQPSMMFISNINYVLVAVIGRCGFGRCDQHRRRPGVHPVLAAVHPATDPGRLDAQPAPVGSSLGRAGLRAPRRARGALDPADADPEPVQGRVAFEDVSFSYRRTSR